MKFQTTRENVKEGKTEQSPSVVACREILTIGSNIEQEENWHQLDTVLQF